VTNDPLWSGLALVGALNARVSGGALPLGVGGISIDTRSLAPGDLFVAIKGESLDGHDYVRTAFERGAVAAVIDEAHAAELSGGAGTLYIVKDTQEALERLGLQGRARAAAYVAAITGSVGKTSTKEMAREVFSHFGPTHASAASYNNQWGVPLSLSRMPADTRFGVFELGMNHAGEIASLVQLVQPHVAVITKVAPAHLEHFSSLEAIADAKAEIFGGLLEGGVAIVNRDDDVYERLLEAARALGVAHVFTFGKNPEAQARLLSYETQDGKGVVTADILGLKLQFRIGAPGEHLAVNALAVLLVAYVFGLDLDAAAAKLEGFQAPKGRGAQEKIAIASGEITLIDESYNANPTSVRAALSLLADAKPGPRGRRIAVLGDMLELGPESGEMHADLAGDLLRARVDVLFTAGQQAARAFYAVPHAMQGAHRRTAAELEEPFLAALRDGDVVMLKGSNSMRMGALAQRLRADFAAATKPNEGP
jgi:UDP-N-acetylmuramoyl-tripeptide--D-alanyl-D-alanine ligase